MLQLSIVCDGVNYLVILVINGEVTQVSEVSLEAVLKVTRLLDEEINNAQKEG